MNFAVASAAELRRLRQQRPRRRLTMPTITLTLKGLFSLATSIKCLEAFAPGSYDGDDPDNTLCLGFPADDGRSTVALRSSQ